MGKIETKSAALKSNLITTYHACYLCNNIQYEMYETSTEIYMRSFSRQYQTRSKQFRIKKTQKRIVDLYIRLILTLPFRMNAKSPP